MTLAGLNAQIRASRERLAELYRQRKAMKDANRWNKRPRNVEILRLWDDVGLDSIEISRRMKLSDTLVRQFLRSRGRTKRERTVARSQLAAMVETMK